MGSEYVPSVNRLLVDLKKLDTYDDPFAALDRLRNTLEECSQKQKMDSVLKLQKLSLSLQRSNRKNQFLAKGDT